jgi:hypothetical protein
MTGASKSGADARAQPVEGNSGLDSNYSTPRQFMITTGTKCIRMIMISERLNANVARRTQIERETEQRNDRQEGEATKNRDRPPSLPR